MSEQIFKIEGFHCDACVRLATMKIKKISDVQEVNVSADGFAKVGASREIRLDEVSKALDGLNYTVSLA